MKMSDIKNKKEGDLREMISQKKEELRAFRFGTSGSKTKDTKVARNIKKDIARIMTFLNSSK